MYKNGKFYIKLAVPDGITFPTHTSIETGSIFYRNDERLLYVYSGEWLAIPTYSGTPSVGNALRWDGQFWVPSGVAGGPSAGSFLGLSDTPASYTSYSGYFPRVTGAEDGLTFGTSLRDVDGKVLEYTGDSMRVDGLDEFTTDAGVTVDTLQVKDGFIVAGGLPGVKAVVAGHSVANTTWTTILLADTEEWDTHDFHSTVTNTNRLTVPTGLGGRYAIGAYAESDIALAAATRVDIKLRKNGSDIASQMLLGTANIARKLTLYYEIELAATDYVDIQIRHNDSTDRDWSSEFFMHRIGN